MLNAPSRTISNTSSSISIRTTFTCIMRNNDSIKKEESRQSLLQNPITKTMIESALSMKEIVGDKHDFLQTVLSGAQTCEDLGSDGGGSMADTMQVWT